MHDRIRYVYAPSAAGTVTLFGFVNAFDPRELKECDHYWECRFTQSRYLAGHHKARAHDWPAQWRVLEALLQAHKGRLSFRGRPASHAHRTACDGLSYPEWRQCEEA